MTITRGSPIYADADCVISDRGGIVENRHYIHAAVVDASGRLIYAVGDPGRVTLIRSTAKPAQGLAVLEALGGDALSDSDVALVCASHSAEPMHISRAEAILALAGVPASALKCGGHPALSDEMNRAWAKADLVPSGIHNNCSGKHAGMLAATVALGAETETYHLPEHPMQVRVRDAVHGLAGECAWAVDGCNLPAPAMGLDRLAGMYVAFANAADAVSEGTRTEDVSAPDAERTRTMARIFNAMATHGALVGGTGRFCTVLMDAYGGRVVGKVGADGCYGVGVRGDINSTESWASGGERQAGNGASVDTTTGALGIAVKVEDGDREILYATVAEILDRLGVGAPEERTALGPFHHVKRRNTADVVVGGLAFPFVLRPVP